MMIVNDDSSVINKLETSLTDDARVIIYDHHVFIVYSTEECFK
jgi:nanoRNase/pAp phosphatase (c-di-AMP/oligoRNAs hydrolase)